MKILAVNIAFRNENFYKRWRLMSKNFQDTSVTLVGPKYSSYLHFGKPIIFDATHSAQLPGGNGETTAGMRDMIPTLAKAAVASGCNGIFMEVHDNVEKAKSDATTQWPLEKLESLLRQLKAINKALI